MANDSVSSSVGTPELAREGPKAGIGLCLSGGGYRAMVFHVGVLWRLNDAGLLPKIDRFSSVSGGSITSACLGMAWDRLAFDTHGRASGFESLVVQPIRLLAGETLDEGSVLAGVLLPGTTVSDRVAANYRRYLFQDATLQDLPDHPRFVINATNVQTGALFRFSKPYLADYHLGLLHKPTVSLAAAVAASSAFPPILSPAHLNLDDAAFEASDGADLSRKPFTTHLVLTDGGVYDNLGMETVWKELRTVLVSDAGAKIEAEESPATDWVRHSIRVLDIVDNQVRSLRKRELIDSYQSGTRQGAYWGIRTDIADYQLSDAFDCPFERTAELAKVPTRLKAMEPELQERLINWGYAVCDAAIRKHVDPTILKPASLPYASAGV